MNQKDSRRLARRFLQLQYHEIVEIGFRLALVTKEEVMVDSNKVLFKKIFERAKDRACVEDLKAMVDEQHGEKS